MNVYIFSCTKRLNSTAQPVVTGLTPIECKLKAPCTVLKPVLEFVNVPNSQYAVYINCNYAYISEFRRYYYITNWTMANAKCIASLEVDVLATFQSSIKSSTQYVLRSDSAWDGNIIDSKYPIKTTQATKVYNAVANPLQPGSGQGGVYVLGIITKGDSITGGISYYVLSPLVFLDLSIKLFNLPTQWGNDTTVVDGIKKAITDPYQYISSIIWLPYSTVDFTSRNMVEAVGSVTVGYDTISVSGTAYYISERNAQFTNVITISIPLHPEAALRGEYLNVAPYTRYFLSFYPFCGNIELDSMYFKGATYLCLVYTVDLRTGKGILNICRSYSGTSYADWQPVTPSRVIEAQCGVSIPTAAIHTALPTSITQSIRNVSVAAAEKIIEGGGFKSMLKRFASTVAGWQGKLLNLNEEQMSAVYENIGAEPITQQDISDVVGNGAAMTSTAELSGSQGTFSFNSRMPLQFWAMHYSITNQDNLTFGRPLCQRVTLSTLSGFCLCATPHIVLPVYAYESEVAEIENALASGVFLEW